MFSSPRPVVNWNPDTLTSNTGIDSLGNLEGHDGYNTGANYRPNSPGTFNAIINPHTYDPLRPNREAEPQPVDIGTRFLIIEDIGDINNTDGAAAWKALDGTDLVAHANDLIEWLELRRVPFKIIDGDCCTETQIEFDDGLMISFREVD